MASNRTSAPQDILQLELQDLLDRAVGKGAAPGLLACVFNADEILVQAAAGVRNVETGEPMALDTTVWMASKSKAVASVAALICVERQAFDIDSHRALAAILPELDLSNDALPSNKIFDGKDSQGKHKFKRATVGITFRHLMTHTSGYGGPAFSGELASLYQPHGGLPSAMTGALAAIDTPRLFEAGTGWMYGFSTDWIGLFIERVTGLPLRQAYRHLVFDPLGISPDHLDTVPHGRTPSNRSAIHVRTNDGAFRTLDLPFVFFEDQPPEGFATLASGPLHGTLSGFVSFCQSLFDGRLPKQHHQPQLLSPSLLSEAMSDGLEHYKLSLPTPNLVTSVQPLRAHSVVGQYCPYGNPADSDKGEGWSMMQAVYSRAKTATGHSSGTIAWSGLANSFYFIDRNAGIGGVIIAQLMPWMDAAIRDVRNSFERWVYERVLHEARVMHT